MIAFLVFLRNFRFLFRRSQIKFEINDMQEFALQIRHAAYFTSSKSTSSTASLSAVAASG